MPPRRACSRVTSASRALGVISDYALYKSTHSLTHSLSNDDDDDDEDDWNFENAELLNFDILSYLIVWTIMCRLHMSAS